MLRFSNSGEIDPRLITTLGVNVKENGSPIGYFGTGLKYAIAGILRTGGRVEIHSGLAIYRFSAYAESIRGKKFSFIKMNDLPLGFTTDLGKNWEPWMWYRELASNTMDEGGQVSQVLVIGQPTPCQTNIYVTGLDEEWAKRDQIFISGKSIFAHEGNAEIYPAVRGVNAVYYRGVKVAMPEKPAMYRYNIMSKLALTEDRTLQSMWEARRQISLTVMRLEDEDMIEKLLLAPQDTFESLLDWDWAFDAPIIDKVTARLMKTRLAEINPLAVRRLNGKKEKARPEAAIMTEHERAMLVEARQFLSSRLGINITVPVRVTESLGSHVHGVAWQNEIYLARLAFEQGVDWLAAVMIEEWCHAERNMADYSRELQTWLLNKIVSAGRGNSSAIPVTTPVEEISPIGVTEDEIPF